MTDERLDEIRKLVAQIASEEGVTWGRTRGGACWTSRATHAVSAYEAARDLLAALDETRERLRAAERVVEAARKVSEADEHVLSAYRVPVEDTRHPLDDEEREQIAAEHERERALSALAAVLDEARRG